MYAECVLYDIKSGLHPPSDAHVYR